MPHDIDTPDWHGILRAAQEVNMTATQSKLITGTVTGFALVIDPSAIYGSEEWQDETYV